MKLKKEVYISDYQFQKIGNEKYFGIFNLAPCKLLTINEVDTYMKMSSTNKIKMTLEVEESILDDVEKRYLSNFIKPFRKNIKGIVKYNDYDTDEQYLVIYYNNSYSATYFPKFPKGKMYKGMQADKKYKLEELGL